MPKFLIFFLLLPLSFACAKEKKTSSASVDSQTPTAASKAKALLIADQVNLRETPDSQGRILATLPQNTSLTLDECQENQQLIGTYFGSWCRVSLSEKDKSTKLEGYLLSSFIDSPALPDEKFHLFLSRFDKALKTNDHSVLRPLFKTPLSYQVCEEGNCKSEPITFDALLHTLDYRPQAFMYKPTYRYEEGKLSLLYGYEAFYTTIYFALQNHKWQIEAVSQTRD